VSDPTLTVEARIPDALQTAVAEQLARASEEDVAGRIAREDAALWGPSGTPELANRLGWLTIAQRMLGELGALELFAAEAHDDELEDIVLLGMGGSSLAPEVLRRSFAGTGSPAAQSSRCRCSRTSSRSSRRATGSSRSQIPARAWKRSPPSTPSGGRSPEIRTSAGATARCPPSASCRAR